MLITVLVSVTILVSNTNTVGAVTHSSGPQVQISAIDFLSKYAVLNYDVVVCYFCNLCLAGLQADCFSDHLSLLDKNVHTGHYSQTFQINSFLILMVVRTKDLDGLVVEAPSPCAGSKIRPSLVF